MGHRITWRARPRSEYPWPLRVCELAEFPASYPSPDLLLGPFTMQAVTEILYRAKAFDCEGFITGEFADTSLDEKRIFEEIQYSGIDVTSPVIFADDGVNGCLIHGLQINLNYFDPSDNIPWAEIYKLPDGFYLNGRISYTTPDSFIDNEYALAGTSGTLTLNIVLNCGTFPIDIYGFTSATPTLTAVEWWPYATTAGADAWDTSTGAPANGGPGA